MHLLDANKPVIPTTDTKIIKKRFFCVFLVFLCGILCPVSNSVFGQGVLPRIFTGSMKGNDRLSKDDYTEIVDENKKATINTTQILEKLNTITSLLDNENKATREISPDLKAMEEEMEEYINFAESYIKTRNDNKLLQEIRMLQKYRKKLGFKKYRRYLKRRLDVFERELLNNRSNYSEGNAKLEILRKVNSLEQIRYNNTMLPEIAY